jgi:hypothetical protein
MALNYPLKLALFLAGDDTTKKKKKESKKKIRKHKIK